MGLLSLILIVCLVVASAILAIVLHIGHRSAARADREQNNS